MTRPAIKEALRAASSLFNTFCLRSALVVSMSSFRLHCWWIKSSLNRQLAVPMKWTFRPCEKRAPKIRICNGRIFTSRISLLFCYLFSCTDEPPLPSPDNVDNYWMICIETSAWNRHCIGGEGRGQSARATNKVVSVTRYFDRIVASYPVSNSNTPRGFTLVAFQLY